jgi:hypothetical protein
LESTKSYPTSNQFGGSYIAAVDHLGLNKQNIAAVNEVSEEDRKEKEWHSLADRTLRS